MDMATLLMLIFSHSFRLKIVARDFKCVSVGGARPSRRSKPLLQGKERLVRKKKVHGIPPSGLIPG